MKRLGILSLLFGLYTTLSWAASPDLERHVYKIGVLAYKGKADAVKRWQGHAEYLSQQLAPIRFEVTPLSYQQNEMTSAIKRREVDFVITNPGHYIELELAGDLSRLATRRVAGEVGALDQFGGTAVTRPAQTEINRYADLEGKTVLIPSQSSLGGWQVHLREAIAQGLDLRDDSTIIELKNHRKVVQAILRGEGDVGFVRSDLVEELVSKGELQFGQLKVVNQVTEAGYPYRLSTRLYPEWPFARVSGISSRIAEQVLLALMQLESTAPAARSAGIAGWTVPGHYSAVGELFREAGLGPYAPQPPTFVEIVKQYWIELIVITLMVALLLFISTLREFRANRQLRLNEKRLLQAANVFKYADEGIMITDAKASILEVNRAFCAITGFSREEVVGESPGLLHSGRQSARFYQEMWESLLQTGYWSGTLWNRKKGGDHYAEQMTITSIQNKAGEVEQYVGVFRDITKQLEDELKLKGALQAKDEFLACMSHELRTPLTAIIGNSESLSTTALNQQQQQFLKTIERASHRQLALVNDILDLSKIESGKFEVSQQPYDLGALIGEVEEIFMAQAEREGLHFKVSWEGRFDHLLLGDRQRIDQVLINLLSNAFKFTERGEVVLKIGGEGERLRFRVSDQGIGMSAATVDRLFLPFEQADSSISRRFGGTGLGLYISSQLVALMEGTITVESEEGQGSHFEVSLPLLESELPLPTETVKEVENPCYFEGAVLVAEDSSEIQDLQRRLLEEVGVDVTIAVNGEEAVDRALAQPFDLILMDMQMPVMDGIEATQRLREAGSEVPIVAVSGNVMERHKAQMQAAGCKEFITKPFVRRDLYALLERYLNPVEQPVSTKSQSALEVELDGLGDLISGV